MRDASSLVLAARLQGEGARSRLRPGRRGAGPASCCRRRAQRLGRGGARGRRRRDPGHRVAASSPSSTGRSSRRADGEPADRRRAQLPRSPTRCAPPASPTRASARPSGPRGRTRRRLMQALVLVGGEGTRLRPLTLTQPKPALPLVDRPFIRYMVDWLARHGVDGGRDGLRLPRRGAALGARRRGPRRPVDPLRRGARAAGHRRPDPARRRRAACSAIASWS